MSAVVLGLKITSNVPGVGLSRGAGRRWVADRRYETMLSVAAFWHRQLFPKHFGAQAAGEYNIPQRTEFYRDVTKPIQGRGRGKQKRILEFLTGQSLRWMRDLTPSVSGRRNITLRMKPPGYFTNPFIGIVGRTRDGRTKRITQQPDKPDEVTRVSPDDDDAMVNQAERFLSRRIRVLPPPQTRTIK